MANYFVLKFATIVAILRTLASTWLEIPRKTQLQVVVFLQPVRVSVQAGIQDICFRIHAGRIKPSLQFLGVTRGLAKKSTPDWSSRWPA
jgi:hypothetical protein